MTKLSIKTVAIIVAHPDDETLWAGGTIMSHPLWNCYIICLCRGSDKERTQKFYETLKLYNSKGAIGDLDDGPDQKPLDQKEVDSAILNLLPIKHYDLIISHNPSGEYTRHLRHEEVSKSVIELWQNLKISTTKLWTFAYEDGNKKYYPIPIESAPIQQKFTKRIWKRKYKIITATYGFEKKSFEAKTTPRTESFWQFTNPYDAKKWLDNRGLIR